MQKPVTVRKRKHETKIERKRKILKKKLLDFGLDHFRPGQVLGITLAKNFDCMNFNNESEQKND